MSTPPHPQQQQQPYPRDFPQQAPPAFPQQAPQPPYGQAPGPYAQAPGPYAQSPGPYAQHPAPGPYQQYPPQYPSPYPPQQQPYSQQPGYPHTAVGYGQPPVPQGGAGAHPNAHGPHGPGCQVCGAAPAAAMTVRGHQGMLVMMRFLRRQGTFCRTCGLALFRKMQSDTMVQGWWGMASILITPLTLLINLFTLSRIRALPTPSGPVLRPSLDPGRPVLARPAGLVGLVPLLGFALLMLLVLIGMVAG